MLAAIALSMQAASQPPIEIRRVQEPAPIVVPDWPWNDVDYALRCEATDSARRESRFNLALSHLGTAVISGDSQFGMNTKSGVLFNQSPPAEHPDVLIRTVTFDAGNLSYVTVTQAFLGGELQSTSFIARHTTQSDGIPNTHQALGFCFPADKTNEAAK